MKPTTELAASTGPKMIRQTGSLADGDSPRQENSDAPDLWCVNPWLTSHMIGAAHSQRIDAAEQETWPCDVCSAQ